MIANLQILDPVSPQGQALSDLFIAISVACCVILAIVTTLVGACIVRFRAKPGAAEPRQVFGNKRMEIAWTIGPFLLLVWMFFMTRTGMKASLPDETTARDPDLIITGHQWWWEARYPKSGVVTANEIHIPVGKRLLVRLESADVVHSFWAIRFGPKMDMIPGHPNWIWLETQKPGTYEGACAEYCGNQHAWMRFFVVAETEKEFGEWEKAMQQPAPDSFRRLAQLIPHTKKFVKEGAQTQLEMQDRGERTFHEMTCANCHAINDGTKPAASLPNAAPDLTHIASRRTLAGGVIENNAADLRRWLKDPQLIKPGCKMPNLMLTDQQVEDLVAYFETLK